MQLSLPGGDVLMMKFVKKEVAACAVKIQKNDNIAQNCNSIAISCYFQRYGLLL